VSYVHAFSSTRAVPAPLVSVEERMTRCPEEFVTQTHTHTHTDGATQNIRIGGTMDDRRIHWETKIDCDGIRERERCLASKALASRPNQLVWWTDGTSTDA
jgi:hypothetical protein